jgi:DNA-binding beta-propeller fold protein YncE
VGIVFVGCNFGQSGVSPPFDRISLPAGIVADPDADLLYVVNSNSDLRYNAGTLVTVDLAKTAATRAVDPQNWPMCTKTRFSRTEPVPGNYCCHDEDDSNILNCNEPQYIQSDATVEIGSFGGDIRLQRYTRGDEVVRRLYMAVRAEPSITFADVTVHDGNASVRCTGSQQDLSAQPAHAFCDDNWRVRRPGGATPGALELPEEPHVLSLDETNGILFVGHLTVTANGQLLGGGVSTLDVCGPAQRGALFAGLDRSVFLPATNSQAIAGLSSSDGGYPGTRIYATARYSAGISGLVLRDPTQLACNPDAPDLRDLTLVTGEDFLSPAFLPSGTDVRGILFADDPYNPNNPEHDPNKPYHPRAFVLHRNDAASVTAPAVLVLLDRTLLADGTPSNAPKDVLELCSGPTAMAMHNAGRGDRIYVTCYDAGQIYIIDPTAFAFISRIDVGVGPTSLVFSPRDAEIAYVASFANSHLSVIDLKPGSPTENHVVQRIGLPHGYGQ